LLKPQQNQEEGRQQVTDITSGLSFVEIFFCLTIIAIIFMSSSFNSPIVKNNYYYAYAATAEEKKQQQQEANDNSNSNNGNKNNISLPNLIQQGSPYLGDPSTAPITIVDFSDFQCYLCARYVKVTEPIINQTYIQTGKAVLVFKHLPNRGFDSTNSSIATQCANDQGKFWDFHQLLYKNQKPIDSGWVSKENVKKFAAKIPGIDMNEFNSCFESQKYKSFVEEDVALASSLGFQDTPSFVIVNSKDGSNPEILKGAHPFASFKAIIDKKLREAR
jgi:protein-disulfide isomerase